MKAITKASRVNIALQIIEHMDASITMDEAE
jgi:hypothetical protein